ncbi:MAG: glycosyltransferase [Bacteroidetes bacterium]|nr:glycosyltransferase [Bacteroidota bacterium]
MNRLARPTDLSLIVAVYNKPDVLRLVLAACARQSKTNFEVIVADDGSGPEVADAVREAQQRSFFPITHLWHEDKGWRKNTMLNNAIRASRTEYLVFIDGDCLPSRHFLRDHWQERDQKTVLLGRRVETSKRWSHNLTMDAIASGSYERYGWQEWMDGLRGDALRIEDGLRITSRLLRRLLLRNVRGMLGSNFSAWKQDLVAVNGFDELYDGPGCGEDSDIQFRLSLLGVAGKSLRNLAIQYHVHHPLTKVSDACWDRFQEVQKRREPRCRFGLEQLPETTPQNTRSAVR